MSKGAKFGFMAVGAIIAALAATLLTIDAERFRPTIEAQLQKALARPVQLGRLSNSWSPLGVRAESVRIGEDPRFGTARPFVTAKEVKLSARLWPLLSRRVEIQSVEIVEPEIELIRRDGVWNYESVGGPKAQAGSSAAEVRLESVDIRDGRVAVTLDAGARVVYPKANISVAGIGPGTAKFSMTAAGDAAELSGNLTANGEMKDGTVKGSLSLRDARFRKASLGEVSANVDLTRSGNNTEIRSLDLLLGKLALRAKGAIRDQQLALDVEVPRAPVVDLIQLAAAFGQGLPPGMKADGVLEGKLQMQGTVSDPKVIGRIDASDLRLSGGAVKREVRSRALRVDLLPEAIRSSQFEVTCGPTRLTGSFSLRNYGTKPLLESALFTENSDLADLLQIAQAYGATDSSLHATGKATVRLRIHGPLVKGATLQLAGKANLEGATVQSPKLADPIKFDRAEITFPSSTEGIVTIGRLEFIRLVLTSVRANATFRGGILRLDPLTANLYGGATSGRIAVDTRGTYSTIALESRLDKIESAQLMSAISSLPQLISGPLAANVKLTLTPKPGEDPLRGLSGNVALKFAAGKLHTMNLLGELNSVARFLGGPKLDDRYTSFVNLQGDLAFDKGVAQTQGLSLDLAEATATFVGSINFVDQSLNMKLLSVLNPKLAEAVGGSRIGGYLTAAVRNAKGELVIPTLVGGTLTKPRLTPDASAIARLKLQNAVPDVLDVVKGGKAGLKDVLGGILGGRTEKKKQ